MMKIFIADPQSLDDFEASTIENAAAMTWPEI